MRILPWAQNRCDKKVTFWGGLVLSERYTMADLAC